MTGPTLTPADVAAVLRVSLAFVYSHWKELGGAKLGESRTSRLRFRPEAIEAYIRAHETRPVRPAIRVDADATETNLLHLRRYAAKKRGSAS